MSEGKPEKQDGNPRVGLILLIPTFLIICVLIPIGALISYSIFSAVLRFLYDFFDNEIWPFGYVLVFGLLGESIGLFLLKRSDKQINPKRIISDFLIGLVCGIVGLGFLYILFALLYSRTM